MLLLQELPLGQQSDIYGKRDARVFQVTSRNKIPVFRSIYEDVYSLLQFCQRPIGPNDEILCDEALTESSTTCNWKVT